VSTFVKCHKIIFYLQITMKESFLFVLKNIFVLLILLCVLSCTKPSDSSFSETIKVSLREVGHQLLLNNLDSTSVVKPIIEIDNDKYQISFENKLEIHPDSLVNIIKNILSKASLPQQYLVEVIQCKDLEVAYSYKVMESVDEGIIPCRSRKLKKECYTVTVWFTNLPINKGENYFLLIFITGIVFLLIVSFLFFKKKQHSKIQENDSNFTSIGRYRFYPEQNKLTKEAIEINLSKKECELLAIFIAQPNQIIKRDELAKRVWEDNGVIVGRSLDTYISKLRKKLKEDDTIKLTNIHGVGYKLEM